MLIVAGRFEGVDERVIAARNLEEVSVGDYVLSGGEIAAMAVLDAVVRLLPGVMGNAASAASESFAEGLLEYPQYTRPQVFEGMADPRGAALRRPRQDRRLAARRGARASPGSGGPIFSQRRNRQSPTFSVWNRSNFSHIRAGQMRGTAGSPPRYVPAGTERSIK